MVKLGPMIGDDKNQDAIRRQEYLLLDILRWMYGMQIKDWPDHAKAILRDMGDIRDVYGA